MWEIQSAFRGSCPRLHVLPWHATSFHVVSQCDIMGPDIILPLLKPDDSTEHTARVHTHTHVDVHTSGYPKFPEPSIGQAESCHAPPVLTKHSAALPPTFHPTSVSLNAPCSRTQADLMARHMSSPMRTQLMAWSGSESGSPETQ